MASPPRRRARAGSRHWSSPAKPVSRMRSGRSSRFGWPTSSGSRAADAIRFPCHASRVKQAQGVRAMKQWQRYAAEFLGTGTLVFVGTSAVAGLFVNGNGGAAILVAPFAFGIGLLAALYAFGEVSGGLFNPAASLGVFLDRRINGRDL